MDEKLYSIIEVSDKAGLHVNTLRHRLKTKYYNGTYSVVDSNGKNNKFTITKDDVIDISDEGSKRKKIRLTSNFLRAVIEKEKNSGYQKVQQGLLAERQEIKDNNDNLVDQLGNRILESFNKKKISEKNDDDSNMKLAAEIAVEFDDKYSEIIRALETKCATLEAENKNIKYTYILATTEDLKTKSFSDFDGFIKNEKKRQKIEEAKKYVEEWKKGNFLIIDSEE